MKKQLTISKKGFVAWLKEQPTSETYNMNSCTECMLSDYLKERHDTTQARMYGTTEFVVEGQAHPCPKWAVKFQQDAIRAPRFRELGHLRRIFGGNFPMTVKEALLILC